MFSRIEFILTETFLSLRRHPMMAFAAITCIAATLFVAGIVSLALVNANRAVDTAINRVRFVVYFHPETSREDARAIYQRIRTLPEVAGAGFETREHAWRELTKKDPGLVRMMDDKNPYPDAVIAKAKDVRDIPRVCREIKGWAGVDETAYNEDVSSFLERARIAVGKIGIGMGIILLLLSLVIVHHTIELTLYARRKEINIMSLVGASPSTIAMPFLLEGAFYGILGGGMSFAFLALLYDVLIISARADFGASLVQLPDMLARGGGALVIAGVLLGVSGSLFSVIKYMNRPRSKVTNA